jgi:hypothetical protein
MQGQFTALGRTGGCEIVSNLSPSLYMQHFEWDLSTCKRFIADPVDAIFLGNRKVNIRNGTSDTLAIRKVCFYRGACSARLVTLCLKRTPGERRMPVAAYFECIRYAANLLSSAYYMCSLLGCYYRRAQSGPQDDRFNERQRDADVHGSKPLSPSCSLGRDCRTQRPTARVSLPPCGTLTGRDCCSRDLHVRSTACANEDFVCPLW